MLENQETDKKSLRVITKKNPDWDELAKDCVAFANASGGKILIGIEDDATLPPPGQKVPDALIEALNKKISQRTINVGITPRKATADNGGEYIELTIFRSAQTIAGRSDGKYFIRVSDDSRPLLPDEMGRLMVDKNAFVWEALSSQKVLRQQYDRQKLDRFVQMIRASERVSAFVKEKSEDELLNYYIFAKGEHLTNLGVLWIGRREDRAMLLYAPVIQFIKYDEAERKANKIVWDDYSLNPMEMIDAVLRDIPDWKESFEISDGLFRKNIPNYDEVVVREMVANALVHRPYTMRGDIFINLFPDRLELHNPGLLPIGVTPENILHTSLKRNEHLAKVFYDLKLMEREGSGYDRMYEVLLTSGKAVPEVTEGNDRVCVTVNKRIVNPAVVAFISRVNQAYDLRQKELISLGLIAQHGSLSALELSRVLDLTKPNGIRDWLGRLSNLGLVSSRGQTKAMEYFVEPDLLRVLEFKGRTNLTAIEPHRLKELIIQDMKIYRDSRIGDIHHRIGKEIPRHKLRRSLTRLVKEGLLKQDGIRGGARYRLEQNP